MKRKPRRYTDEICPHCDGSGEGSHDGARCAHCRGQGVVLEVDDDCDDGEDYADGVAAWEAERGIYD